jgi:hypothetical protein
MQMLSKLAALSAMTLLVGCADNAKSPTEGEVSSSLATESRTSASAYLKADPLASRLPAIEGSCILSIRNSTGKYVSRLVHVAQLSSRTHTSELIRFAYRGWSPLDSFPSRLAICTIQNTADALAMAQRAFRSSVVSLPDLIKEQQPDGSKSSSPSIIVRPERMTLIPAELRSPRVPIVVSDGNLAAASAPVGSTSARGAVRLNGTSSSSQVCTIDPIIPEAGCEGFGGGGGGGYCNVGSLIPEPGCIVEPETPITEPPFNGGAPSTPTVVPPSYIPPTCQAKLEYVHPSSSPDTFGWASVHAWTQCPEPMAVITTTVTLLRMSCFLYIFCNYYPIGIGVDVKANHVFTDANAKYNPCHFGGGWQYFSASSIHTALTTSGFFGGTTMTWKPQGFGLQCAQGGGIPQF